MKHFADVAPMTRSARMKLFKKDPSCFLLPPMRGEMPKYPICDKKGKKLCQGVLSAKMRADLVKNTYGKYSNKRARKSARRVSRKAVKIARDHGCEKMDSIFKKHHKKHKKHHKKHHEKDHKKHHKKHKKHKYKKHHRFSMKACSRNH